MKFRRWMIRMFLLALIPVILGILFVFLLRPSLLERTEIYKGVYLTVEELPDGRAMIAEVHWETPGVQIGQRDYDFEFSPDNSHSPHFRLTLADMALWREAPSLLVNTTRYMPHEPMDSLPGMSVRTLETLVVDGRLSHVHEHSFLIFWDREMNARLQSSKPPSAQNLETALQAMGVQRVDMNNGQIGSFTREETDELYDRTFIGVNPEKKVLYLLVMENVSRYYITLRALQAGATFGGEVDSGNSSTLLVGKGASGIRAHTGIRNLRPLGPYLTVRADPIDD